MAFNCLFSFSSLSSSGDYVWADGFDYSMGYVPHKSTLANIVRYLSDMDDKRHWKMWECEAEV